MTDGIAGAVARALADGKGMAGAVNNIGDARPRVDVKDAARLARHLVDQAESGVGAFAEQVVARGRVRQGPAGNRHQELQIDHAAGAVARAKISLDLMPHEIGVGWVIPEDFRIPLLYPVVLFNEVRQWHKAAAEAVLKVVAGAARDAGR